MHTCTDPWSLSHCWTLSWLSHWNNRPLTSGLHVQLCAPDSGEAWLSSGCVEMRFRESETQRNVECAYRSGCVRACVCVFGVVYCCSSVGTHITVLHLELGCTLLCNLTLSSSNDRDVCVCVCLSTQVAGCTKHTQSCANVCLHVCVCVFCCRGLGVRDS